MRESRARQGHIMKQGCSELLCGQGPRKGPAFDQRLKSAQKFDTHVFDLKRMDHMPRPKGKSNLLTSVELEFMKVLWRIGQGTVREVLEILNERETRAYTSVATTLRVLEEKRFLKSEKHDQSYVYSPSIAKNEYESRILKNISNTLFDGAPTALVARLVDDEDISEETIQEIRHIIDTRFGV